MALYIIEHPEEQVSMGRSLVVLACLLFVMLDGFAPGQSLDPLVGSMRRPVIPPGPNPHIPLPAAPKTGQRDVVGRRVSPSPRSTKKASSPEGPAATNNNPIAPSNTYP